MEETLAGFVKEFGKVEGPGGVTVAGIGDLVAAFPNCEEYEGEEGNLKDLVQSENGKTPVILFSMHRIAGLASTMR